MHLPDGPLESLHSPEQKPFSAFCHLGSTGFNFVDLLLPSSK